MFSCGTQKSGRGAIVIFNTIIVTIITDQLIWNSKDIHLQISAVCFFDTFLKEANSFIGSFLKYNITHTHTPHQWTYMQGHGHDHVSTIYSWNVEDTGTCMRIYPLHRTRWLAHTSWCATQRWCECPNRVPHQHCWVWLDCKEVKLVNYFTLMTLLLSDSKVNL